MSEHLDLDALADALAAESDGQPLPDHVAGCPTCTAALAELRTALGAVANDLGALPAVPAVPAALQAPVAPARGIVGTTVLPEGDRADDRRGPRRWLLPAGGIAAAAVLVIGGGLLLSSNATDSNTTAKSAIGAAGPAVSTSGINYATVKQVQATVPSLLAGNRPAGNQAPLATGTNEGSTVDPLARLRKPAALAACIASLTEPGDPTVPLALDYATYQHRPTLVVVLPAGKPSKVDVFLVGPACNQPESDLYLYVSADRP